MPATLSDRGRNALQLLSTSTPPSAPVRLSPGSQQSPQHAHPRLADLRQRNSPASSPSRRGTRRGDWFPPQPIPTTARAEGSRPPGTLAGPRTPIPCPHSPGLASHDLVLVRDELVYIFQIKLVRHGAAELSPAATTAAPAGGKRLSTLSGPGSFPTATKATRYGGRPRVKLVSETAQAQVGGASELEQTEVQSQEREPEGEGLLSEPWFQISHLQFNDQPRAKYFTSRNHSLYTCKLTKQSLPFHTFIQQTFIKYLFQALLRH